MKFAIFASSETHLGHILPCFVHQLQHGVSWDVSFTHFIGALQSAQTESEWHFILGFFGDALQIECVTRFRWQPIAIQRSWAFLHGSYRGPSNSQNGVERNCNFPKNGSLFLLLRDIYCFSLDWYLSTAKDFL